MDATFAFFLFSFLTLTSAQLSSPSPPPASTTPITPSTACNSTPDPSFCLSVLPPSGAQSLQSYCCFSLAKSLTKAYNFLSLIDHYRGLGASLPAPAARALDDCHLLADLNIDFLTSAGKSLNSTSTTLLDPDAQQIHTLISALLTNHQTCIDGLQDADKTNAVSGVLIPSIVNGTKLYSVSLALFTKAWVPHRKLKESSIKHLTTKMFHPMPAKGRRHLLFHEVKISSDGRLPLRMSEEHRAVIERRMGRRLLQSSESVLIKATVVVTQDGTGNFTTISEAVASAPNKTDGSDGYYLIFVSAGIYQEYVSVSKNKRYIMMIGDGINQTIVTGNHNNIDGWTTFNSATFAVVGQGFVGINMTFQNTAGAIKHQAVAVRNGADLSTFYFCSFEGYQDTLYAHSMRQFYTQCNIYGTVDYIFGNSAVVFQNCNMYSRLPMQGQQNTITAQGRIDPNQNTGISIQGGDFLAAADLAANNGSTRTFLGRPWKNYSRTVIMDAFMDDLIQPAGWLPWDGDFALSTLYYAEYNNSGPGSNTIGRVTWPGYHVLTNSTEVMNFTISNFIMGDYWIPQTGVPYTGGLL